MPGRSASNTPATNTSQIVVCFIVFVSCLGCWLIVSVAILAEGATGLAVAQSVSVATGLAIALPVSRQSSPSLQSVCAKMSSESSDDDDFQLKAKEYMRLRMHVRKLKKASNVKGFAVCWPVDSHMKPLNVSPNCILSAKRLEDITWHDVPTPTWNRLSRQEQEELERDVWFYSNTGIDEDGAQAAVELAKKSQHEQ